MHGRECAYDSKADDPDIFKYAYYPYLEREQGKDLLIFINNGKRLASVGKLSASSCFKDIAKQLLSDG